jgi:hypothetical protein
MAKGILRMGQVSKRFGLGNIFISLKCGYMYVKSLLEYFCDRESIPLGFDHGMLALKVLILLKLIVVESPNSVITE